MGNFKLRLKEMIKKLLRKPQQRQHRKIIAQTARHITREQMVSDLQALGVKAGDVIFLHSSLKSVGFVEGGARSVVEALDQAVSPGGTLIVPAYSMVGGSMYTTCQAPGYVFDPRTAGTGLGAIPEAVLKFPGVRRSIHPTHSVAAVGGQAERVTASHHLARGAFGPDSPWDRLIKLDGKVLGLGISLGPVTFYHAVEDQVLDEFPLPVRMKETFLLKCRDDDGNLITVPVNPLDPKFSHLRIDHADREDLRQYLRQEFLRAGIMTLGKVGDADAWIIPARLFYDHLVRLMKEGITIYSTPEELKRRPI